MKEVIKKLFIPLLASRPVTVLASKLFDVGVPVFMIHRLSEHSENGTGKLSPEHLRNCLDHLVQNNYTFVSLEELVLALKNRQKLPPKSVVFTMDDGYIDQAEIAAPIFLEYNCPLTFFVITGMIDQAFWPWDAKVSWIIETSTKDSLESCSTVKQLNLDLKPGIDKRRLRRSIQGALKKIDARIIPDILLQLANDAGVDIPKSPPSSYQPITWDIARKLEEQGVRFAPHSVYHNILSRLSQHAMENEVIDAWTKINTELVNPLKVFCYPTGRPVDYGEREIETLRNTDYLGAVSTIPGFVKPDASHNHKIYSLPRLAMPDNMTDFIKYCSWIESVRESIFKKKKHS